MTVLDALKDVWGSVLALDEVPIEFGPATFLTDLDSLDKLELLMGLEDGYNIEIEDATAATWHTVADVIRYLNERGITDEDKT